MTQTTTPTQTPLRITVINPRIPVKAKLKVAAYARVSRNSEDPINSYLAQVDYYSKHISANDNWELVDIYAGEGFWNPLLMTGRSRIPKPYWTTWRNIATGRKIWMRTCSRHSSNTSSLSLEIGLKSGSSTVWN